MSYGCLLKAEEIEIDSFVMLKVDWFVDDSRMERVVKIGRI